MIIFLTIYFPQMVNFSMSNSGMIIFRENFLNSTPELKWVSPEGRARKALFPGQQMCFFLKLLLQMLF